MQLFANGAPRRSKRYTSIPHGEVGSPQNHWTVYYNPAHTDYVPLSPIEGLRKARAQALAKTFGVKPIHRDKGEYQLYLVRVPTDPYQRVEAWDGETFIEQESGKK